MLNGCRAGELSPLLSGRNMFKPANSTPASPFPCVLPSLWVSLWSTNSMSSSKSPTPVMFPIALAVFAFLLLSLARLPPVINSFPFNLILSSYPFSLPLSLPQMAAGLVRSTSRTGGTLRSAITSTSRTLLASGTDLGAGGLRFDSEQCYRRDFPFFVFIWFVFRFFRPWFC